MKAVINSLMAYERLSSTEARDSMLGMMNGAYNAAEIATLLTVFSMRPLTLHELTGFRQALMDSCIRLDFSQYNTIDLCGTGGDGKNTFNISTLAAFIVAGAGQKVVKHGNYGLSSHCGSSNLLEALGYTFTTDESHLKEQLDEAGLCFLHAPLFHPSMQQVATIRKALGRRTFFNTLGPLVNPSKPNSQLLGVCNLELARLYRYFFQQHNISYTIVHTVDGYDEIANTSPCYVANAQGVQTVSPEDMGLKTCTPAALHGGKKPTDAVSIFMRILEGNGSTAQNEVGIANAAWALHTAQKDVSLPDCILQARTSLQSKKALNCLKKLLRPKKNRP